FDARNAPTTPSTSNSRAASGETSGLGADSKCALAAPSTTCRPSTHLMLLGFGVRSACMRNPRSIRDSGGSIRLNRPRAIANTAAVAPLCEAREPAAQTLEHVVHVGVQLLLPSCARDTRERERPAEQPRDRPRLREQALRIERAPSRGVVRTRQLALERRLETVIARGQRQGAPDRTRDQQIALDVPAPPREELEPVRAFELRRSVFVAVEHGQAARPRYERAQGFDRA